MKFSNILKWFPAKEKKKEAPTRKTPEMNLQMLRQTDQIIRLDIKHLKFYIKEYNKITKITPRHEVESILDQLEDRSHNLFIHTNKRKHWAKEVEIDGTKHDIAAEVSFTRWVA